MVFKFAGIPSAGYRDDGRSLILRWPISKPPDSLHAVESWHHATSQALKRWNLPIHPLSAKKTLGLRLADRHGTQSMQTIDAAELEPGHFIFIAPTATGLHLVKIKRCPTFHAPTAPPQTTGPN